MTTKNRAPRPLLWKATAPLSAQDFPAVAGKEYPIVEVFGHDRHLLTSESHRHFNERLCPLTGTTCEKFVQYGFGYCSVRYTAKHDGKNSVYAVCDHRLDGEPVRLAAKDYFGAKPYILVPEIKLSDYSISFDYVAINEQDRDFCVIETQAIDLRGGGVGPAWDALERGKPREWRKFFSVEAQKKNRDDTVAYGINTANILKRLGLQVAQKGELIKSWGKKLYVVTQDRTFDYLKGRLTCKLQGADHKQWDISFFTYDYATEEVDKRTGMWPVALSHIYRVGLEEYAAGLTNMKAELTAEEFIGHVLVKQKKGKK
jgi:hypothetical protein